VEPEVTKQKLYKLDDAFFVEFDFFTIYIVNKAFSDVASELNEGVLESSSVPAPASA